MSIEVEYSTIKKQVKKKKPKTKSRWTEPIPTEKTEPSFINEPPIMKDWEFYSKQVNKKKPTNTSKKETNCSPWYAN